MSEPYGTGPKSTAIETHDPPRLAGRRMQRRGAGRAVVVAGRQRRCRPVRGDQDRRRVEADPHAGRLQGDAPCTAPSGRSASPLNAEKRKGTFACAGCDLPLFASDTKFESGTGWPSFFQPLPNAVATSSDRSLLMPRTEVHCRRCGGHLGHVFEDGPPPTGLRYCINGVALTFAPAASSGPA